MRRTIVALLPFLLFAFSPAPAQQLITGTVRDTVTGLPLDAASIRERGSSRGTITNSSGRFTLALPSGPHELIASMLGYRPDTVRIALPADSACHFALTPAEILLPEVVVVAEDPAVGIIRKAIAARHRWEERLTSYEMQAFTRQTLRRDTAIAAITESYTSGYWHRGDTLREVVHQRRQTANIPAADNFASVGRILNFNEDRIRFAGYSFVGPTADDALDHYHYRLLRRLSSGLQEIFEIRVEPGSRTTPLFEGTIMIADGSFALMGVDVGPNEAFQIPFVRTHELRYRQQFALYDGTFWMPVDIRVAARFVLGIPGITFPAVAFEQTSVITDYAINTLLPDSLFRRPRLVVDSTAMRLDTAYWASHRVLPLDPQEQAAYAELDTTQSLDVQFRPGGLTATLADRSGGGALFSALDVWFNRVEGLHLGAHAAPSLLASHLTLDLGGAYAFSQHRGVYRAGLMLYPSQAHALGAGIAFYREFAHRSDHGYYGALANSLASLLAKADYFDYYEAVGWQATLHARPLPLLRLEATYFHEEHSSVLRKTNFSIFYPSRRFRENPPVQEGPFRSVRLYARLGKEHVPLDLAARDVLEASVERASPGLTGGAFDFTRYDAAASVSVTTLGRDMLFPAALRLSLTAGGSAGSLPYQRAFVIESALSGVGTFGVMRTVRNGEFGGTSYAAAAVEHNFRNLPFLALGIPFLYDTDLIVRAATARSWNRGPLPLQTTQGWYAETGLGLGRILELLRADLTWRLAAPRGLFFTLSASTLL